MKKVAVLARSFSTGGAQRVTANLANALVANGFTVDAVCLYEYALDYPIDNRINIINRASSKNKIIGVIQRIFNIAQVMLSKEYCCVIDLVPCFRYYNLIKRISNVPYIASERMYPDACYTGKQKRLAQSAYSSASLVVFQTEEQAQCFDLSTINHCIIPNAVMSMLPRASSVKCPVVITAARMNKQKNLSLLVEAFGMMHDAIPESKLIIYGASTEYDRDASAVLDKINALGLLDSVEIKKFSSNLHNEMCKAMLFVSSSDYEGIQNALLEALTMGIPCVATDCLGGGARLVLDEGKLGHLVPRDNPVMLSKAMIEVVQNYKGEKKRAEHASKLLKDRFSEDVIYATWISAINSVVD